MGHRVPAPHRHRDGDDRPARSGLGEQARDRRRAGLLYDRVVGEGAARQGRAPGQPGVHPLAAVRIAQHDLDPRQAHQLPRLAVEPGIVARLQGRRGGERPQHRDLAAEEAVDLLDRVGVERRGALLHPGLLGLDPALGDQPDDDERRHEQGRGQRRDVGPEGTGAHAPRIRRGLGRTLA